MYIIFVLSNINFYNGGVYMRYKKSFFSELTSSLNSLRDTDKKRYEAVKQIYDYVIGGTWSKKSDAKEVTKIRLMFSNKKTAMDALGLSDGAYRKTKQRLSDKFYKLFGEDVIPALTYGSNEEFLKNYARVKMIISERNANTIFLSDLMMIADNGTERSYMVEELEDEISFLREHTKTALIDKYHQVDEDKISYILDTINSTDLNDIDVKLELMKKILK